MAKVITFSRVFPGYHPKAGEPTNFVEKIWESFIQTEQFTLSRCCELSRHLGIGDYNMNNIRQIRFEPKHHTIRAGHRFYVGECFSPRIWSGKPYRSKQLIIGPDIEIKSIWNFKIKSTGAMYLEGFPPYDIDMVAKNDGLSNEDFLDWFEYPRQFTGQIICWNEKINY